jgi:Flp pilus assembly protein TadD
MPTVDERYDEAIALKETGDLEGSATRLEDILKTDANYALAHSALSVIYGKLERYDEAVSHAQKVCELEADDPFSFVALSLICQKAGLLREAETASAQARRIEGGL